MIVTCVAELNKLIFEERRTRIIILAKGKKGKNIEFKRQEFCSTKSWFFKLKNRR